MSRLNFKLEAEASGSRARATTFTTLHNEVRTPIFMPVGTQATVRGQTVETLERAGAEVLLANTWHLLLRPGAEVFRRAGGIHKFMNWRKSVLTDSGGFQIFSLPHSRRMTEEGAEFQSYVDKRTILLSPELSIETQKAIGSDIMMVLDQCVPSTCEYSVALEAMHRTHRWARRSLDARGDSPQSMFGIIQGACFADLRRQSAEHLAQLPFDGFAIGGLAVGESRQEREDFTELTAAMMPRNLPRYLMGVGTPIDLLEAVHRGVDMFDCILPVALAQQGVAWTSRGEIRLRRTVFRFSDDGLDPACTCPTCGSHTRAYLHHLIKAKEILGWQLIATHNLYFYHQLMAEMREAILNDSFARYYREKKPLLELKDEDNPVTPPRRSRKRAKHPLTLGDYEVHFSPQGFASIRQRRSGEIMHSVTQPEVEAKRLYIEQCGLRERLVRVESADLSSDAELVIWDVGLGAATNAMAAIECHEEAAGSIGSGGSRELRPLHLVSFENDLDSLKLALKHPDHFKHLRHAAPHALVREGQWRHPQNPLKWTLLEGDFLARMAEAPAPDIIFYDPFSFRTDSPLWTVECFRRLHQACSEKPVELFTYSASTAVRAALLSAGFFVAKGVGTGPKAETTIALAGPGLSVPHSGVSTSRHTLLAHEWLERWERSGARVPPGVGESEVERFLQSVREHRQFVRIDAGADEQLEETRQGGLS